MSVSFERIREAAAVLREHPLFLNSVMQAAAQRLDDWADEVEVAESAELDAHAKVLFEAVYPWMTYDADLGDRWRDAARASKDYLTPEPLFTTAPESEWTATVTEQPAAISADATGLKGKRARVVGPLVWADGTPAGWLKGVPVVKVLNLDSDGDAHVEIVEGKRVGYDGHIAASSLALIPEPEVVERSDAPMRRLMPDGTLDGPDTFVPEPPVGTRLRDRDGKDWWVRSNGLVSGSRIPHGHSTVAELLAQNGPLHQVWERFLDVPPRTVVTGRNGSNYVRLGTPDEDVAWRTAIQNIAAPFVAVDPYPTTQIGAHDV